MAHSKKMIDKMDKYMMNKQYETVIKECTDLYTTQRDNGTYLNYILESYRNTTIINDSNTKIYVDAIRHLKKLLTYTQARTPEFCILHNEIGMYYVNCNDHKTAIYHFKQILTVKNDISDVFNNIAVCHITLKEYNQALVCLNISLRLHPCDSVYSRLGELYLHTKQYDASIKAYESLRNPSARDLYNLCFPYLSKSNF